MKINRTFSLDIEAVELLKEQKNASDFISNLIIQNSKRNEMTKEQLLLEIEKNKIKKKAEEKIKELENGR